MTDETPAYGCTINGVPAMPILVSEYNQLVTDLAQARATNQRLNLRAQALESELAAYRRAVAQWEVSERGTYVPLRTIAAIAKAAGRDIENPRWLLHYQRVEQAEAAVKRVRALVAEYPAGIDTALIEEALDTQAGQHVYLSTGCFHGDHDYCKAMTGLNGAKRPASCKKCGAKCICGCHGAEETASPAAAEATAPVHCPCGGVHFPSPDSCRWCKCHRMRATPVPAATAATDRATRTNQLAAREGRRVMGEELLLKVIHASPPIYPGDWWFIDNGLPIPPPEPTPAERALAILEPHLHDVPLYRPT